MGYINFDKTQLINLEYSLNKELVRSNRSGAFSCSTILGCNTRKYHGLLIAPQPHLDGEQHVLLSKVDETVIQREAAFNLGVNKYPGSFHPKGHKYVRNFSADIIPVVTYRVGGVVLTKETMFVTEKEMVLIRYTLVEAHSPTRLRLQPFLAFRNIHRLSKRNIDLHTRYDAVPNGIKVKMYDGYSDLFLQLSKKSSEYVHAPDWFNDLEYVREQERGYEHHEDLYVPGFFEVPIKTGESIVLAASTKQVHPGSITKLFNAEIKKRRPRDSFKNSLMNAAEQFFMHKQGEVSINQGYPWYDYSGRYTFIALPGLAMASGQKDICRQVIDSMLARLSGPQFPESYKHLQAVCDAADTPLWFFRTVQLCFAKTPESQLWQEYGSAMKLILDGYAAGDANGVRMKENAMLHIDPAMSYLSWMNAVSGQHVHTPRFGYLVEVNALWYNAIAYALDLAKAAGDKDFIAIWKERASLIRDAYMQVFWYEEGGFLADFVFDGNMDISIRPNQMIAAAMPYSPLSEMAGKQIMDVVVKRLLTPRGIRSLSPDDPRYKGRYMGDAYSRNAALHQGSVWVWLLGLFADAWFKVYGPDGVDFIQKYYDGFEATLTEAGIGTVSEIYDGDPPHHAAGAISYAASVAELLRIGNMIKKNAKRT